MVAGVPQHNKMGHMRAGNNTRPSYDPNAEAEGAVTRLHLDPPKSHSTTKWVI